MCISDWSSDVCSSDLAAHLVQLLLAGRGQDGGRDAPEDADDEEARPRVLDGVVDAPGEGEGQEQHGDVAGEGTAAEEAGGLGALGRLRLHLGLGDLRPEERTPELQSLMRIPYAI